MAEELKNVLDDCHVYLADLGEHFKKLNNINLAKKPNQEANGSEIYKSPKELNYETIENGREKCQMTVVEISIKLANQNPRARICEEEFQEALNIQQTLNNIA